MTGAPEAVLIKEFETPKKADAIILDELRSDFADWMTAKEDLVWRPSIELSKEGDEFALRTLVPGIGAKDIEVLVAPDILLFRGKAKARKLLGSIKFPRAVNPARVRAELKDGMLSIKARVAKAEQLKAVMPRAA